MNFFKPFDFGIINYSEEQIHVHAANIANAKLEREAVEINWVDGIRKAVILSKEICTHPDEKVSFFYVLNEPQSYKCECGARLKPKTYEEIK